MDDKITITLCGDGGCGKSSITLRIVRSQWTHDYDPTIEDSYSVTRTIDGTTYSIAITDTAGQEEYRGMWSASNLNSDAFLLVYDITSPQSLQALDFFTELIQMEREVRSERGECWPAIMVAGNKCDLQSQRQVGAREGLEWAKLRGCGFMETSAREMVNVEETFAVLVKRVVEARQQYAAGIRPRLPSLTNPGPTQLQSQPQSAQTPDIQQQQPQSQPHQPSQQPQPDQRAGTEAAPVPTAPGYTEKSSRPQSSAGLQAEPKQPKKKKSFLSSLRCF